MPFKRHSKPGVGPLFHLFTSHCGLEAVWTVEWTLCLGTRWVLLLHTFSCRINHSLYHTWLQRSNADCASCTMGHYTHQLLPCDVFFKPLFILPEKQESVHSARLQVGGCNVPRLIFFITLLRHLSSFGFWQGRLWVPAEIKESTKQSSQKRRIRFSDSGVRYSKYLHGYCYPVWVVYFGNTVSHSCCGNLTSKQRSQVFCSWANSLLCCWWEQKWRVVS